jgi:hypothetical protein
MRVPLNGVLRVAMETLEYKLFPAIEFCIEVPRDRAEKGINILKENPITAACDGDKSSFSL